MKGTGVAGRPEEYFEARRDTGLPPHPGDYLVGLPRTGAGIRDDATPPQAPEYSSLAGLRSYREHLDRSFELGTTPNDVFAAKLMWNHVAELCALAGDLVELGVREPGDLLERLFGSPRYVWVKRRDHVRQAISLWRALQTRAWRAEHGTNGGGEPELHYSFDGIDHLVQVLTGEDAGWDAHFRANGVEPLTVVYEEDLLKHRDQTLERVLDHIGVEMPSSWRPPVQMKRQTDALTESWAAAYRRDAAAAGARA